MSTCINGYIGEGTGGEIERNYSHLVLDLIIIFKRSSRIFENLILEFTCNLFLQSVNLVTFPRKQIKDFFFRHPTVDL